MLTPLTNTRTKELEQITIPYDNVIFRIIDDKPFLDTLHEVHNWYNDDIKLMNSSLFKKVDYLSNKFGFKQNYYKTLWYRYAVWGFSFGEYEGVIYYSNRGLNIQVEPDIPILEVKSLINFLNDLWTK